MKNLIKLSSLLMFLVLFSACGSSSSSGVTDVTISGTLSDTVSSKPGNGSAPLQAISDWSSATVVIISSAGTSLGSTPANSDGSYTISNVASGSNYVVRASVGNLVLKVFIETASTDTTADVNATTTANVLIMEVELGVSLGEEGTSAATELASVTVSTLVSDAASNSSATATAIASEIEADGGFDSAATTATIGASSTDTSVTAAVDTAATEIDTITTTDAIDVTGTWSGTLTLTGTLVSDSSQSATMGPFDWGWEMTQSGTTVTATDYEGEAWPGTVSGSTLTLTDPIAGCNDEDTAALIFTVSGTTMTATSASGVFCTSVADVDEDVNFTALSGTLTKQ